MTTQLVWFRNDLRLADHAALIPGAMDTITALRPRLESLPPTVSRDLVQSWVRSAVFEHWAANPVGNFPLVRLSEADAAAIGSVQRVAVLSPETLSKQLKRHPDVSIDDYAKAQAVVDRPTGKIVQDARNLVFVQDDPAKGGFVLVVKAVVQNGEMFITSYRRLSSRAANGSAS